MSKLEDVVEQFITMAEGGYDDCHEPELGLECCPLCGARKALEDNLESFLKTNVDGHIKKDWKTIVAEEREEKLEEVVKVIATWAEDSEEEELFKAAKAALVKGVTLFWDMHSGGDTKEDWDTIIIEAEEEEACLIFFNRFGHNTRRVSCSCCGEDYSVWNFKDIETAIKFREEKPMKVIRKKDIKADEREGESGVWCRMDHDRSGSVKKSWE